MITSPPYCRTGACKDKSCQCVSKGRGLLPYHRAPKIYPGGKIIHADHTGTGKNASDHTILTISTNKERWNNGSVDLRKMDKTRTIEKLRMTTELKTCLELLPRLWLCMCDANKLLKEQWFDPLDRNLYLQAEVLIKQGKSEGFDSCERPSNLAEIDQNHQFFSPCDLEIWWMTSIINRVPLLHYIKLCASFQIHRWIQAEVIVRTRSTRVKIDNFLSRVTLKFDGWSWKTIGHLFYVASSFVHHFIAISEFKLELQPGNPNLCQNRQFFVPCDLEIWRMTLKNNRAPLLCYFKLCASFRSHWWIQTGVTVRKRPIWVKIDDFF